MNKISVYNISNLPTCNFELFKELQQDFKISDPLKETKLENTILTRGFKYAFVGWKDENNQIWIIDAHRRKRVLSNLQEKGFYIPEIPYYLIQAKDKKEAVEEIAFVNSHYADINPNSSLFDDYGIDLGVLDIELPELNFDIVSPVSQKNSASLNERFIVPPFSILDTRQGYWQERKQTWIHSLGMRSELGGRNELKSSGSLSGTIPGYYLKKEECEAKIKQNLTNKEFEEKYLLSYLSKDSIIATTDTGGILSVFDPVLTEVIYSWFIPEGGLVFDPFAGGSVRGIVASWLGLKYIGIDLRKEQVEENIKQATEILTDHQKPIWVAGNSRNADMLVSERSDLVFSCPPYFDLEVYSDDKEDLSNLDYEEFKVQYNEIIQKSCDTLNENRFACFVVGDVRDKQGVYRNFVDYTKKCFVDAGLHFYNEIILVNVAGSLPIRVGRQFNASRKVGKMHQNVLVFYKGNPKDINKHFSKIDFSKFDEDEN